MKILLTSFGHHSIPEFVGGTTLAYVGTAARSITGADFPQRERKQLEQLGLQLVDLPLEDLSVEQAGEILDRVDGVYVAGGESPDLLHVLQTRGHLALLKERVAAGLPYIGASAGSAVAAPSIDYVMPMDDAQSAPELTDLTALGLTDLCVVPHAAGNLPPYPIQVIAEIVAKFGADHRLVLLRDGEALRIHDDEVQLLGAK